MSQYIDVDLMKESLVESANGEKKKLKIAEDISRLLDITPKADVEPVVRCKDCVHYNYLLDNRIFPIGTRFCRLDGAIHMEYHYCSDGVKRIAHREGQYEV